jgi:hypothetical protein
MSKFKKKRSVHRPVAPLRKQFVETIVIQT